MRSTSILFAIGITSTYALPVQDAALTPSVASITHWGDGCPQTATDFVVKGDANCITAQFGSFDVKIGANVAQSDSSEFCEMGVVMSVPAGQQFSVASTNYLDVLDVGSGVTGTHLMTYTFSGSSDVAETRRDFVGPVKGNFNNTDGVARSNRVWSPCGSAYTLLITNRGYVTTGGGSGSGDGSFNVGPVSTVLEWRSC